MAGAIRLGGDLGSWLEGCRVFLFEGHSTDKYEGKIKNHDLRNLYAFFGCWN